MSTMNALPEEIRNRIKGWLEAGEIQVFIGYSQGPMPLRASPLVVQSVGDVDQLIWDASCEQNLAALLPRFKGQKVGLMVKPCDARAVVGLMQEGQVVRENLRLVSAPCTGVVDPRQVAKQAEMPLEDLDEAQLLGERVQLGGVELALEEVRYHGCASCTASTPLIYDARWGEPHQPSMAGDPFVQVREIEALPEGERWDRFAQEMSRCTLCYACRNACPLCYCNVCFADRTMPRWVNQTVRPEDIQGFQIIRTFHLAGRCVGCEACSRACPQGINLRPFLDKLRLDVQELYGYEAGADLTAHPPLTTFREDDYNEFVL